VNAPTARDVVNVILFGIPWWDSHAGPYMPGFATALTDQQVTALTAYLRARYSSQPPWRDVEAIVHEARQARDRS
jgi:mono/diheme cytochrome c family protein